MDGQNSYSNIPESIKAKIGRSLHNNKNHPVGIVKEHIYKFFKDFKKFDTLSPFVDVVNNFDLLRIPVSHTSRSKSDTYYVNETTVLRTHTSAHQNELLKAGEDKFLVAGDVYRKDEIDSCHFPVFHQLEGVCLLNEGAKVTPEEDLINTLTELIKYLFPGCEYRFKKDYFPFTEPSFEAEVKYKDKWMEILGCGVVHHEILDRLNIKKKGWAFGLGMDRLAMIFFKIPDIRLLWTNDPKFLTQFKEGQITEYKPIPSLDPLSKDISFWVDDKFTPAFHLNSFYEVVRETFGDDIARVELFDQFFHKKKNMQSYAFRLTFSPVTDANNPAEFFKDVVVKMKLLGENIRKIGAIVR